MLWVYDPLPPPFYNYAGWLCVGLGILATLSMLTTTYRITDRELLVRFLMLQRRIPLKGIERVAEKRGIGLTARYGYSRDALEVKYKTDRMVGSLVISPQDKDTFMWELTKAMSGADVPNGSLASRS